MVSHGAQLDSLTSELDLITSSEKRWNVINA